MNKERLCPKQYIILTQNESSGNFTHLKQALPTWVSGLEVSEMARASKYGLTALATMDIGRITVHMDRENSFI